MRTIGLAITSMDREDMVFASFDDVQYDRRIEDIVIVDGSPSATFERMKRRAIPLPYVRLYQNTPNIGPYMSKREAVQRSGSLWVVVFDSDNTLPRSYVDALFSLPLWDPEVLYVPEWAAQSLDYRVFTGVTVTKENVALFLDQPLFLTALNTGNFFVNKNAYLDVAYNSDERFFVTDCLYFVYRWLGSGRQVYFVPNLHYTHCIHRGHWAEHQQQITQGVEELTQNMRTGKWHA